MILYRLLFSYNTYITYPRDTWLEDGMSNSIVKYLGNVLLNPINKIAKYR